MEPEGEPLTLPTSATRDRPPCPSLPPQPRSTLLYTLRGQPTPSFTNYQEIYGPRPNKLMNLKLHKFTQCNKLEIS